jgi:circadian clock protein KaiC
VELRSQLYRLISIMKMRESQYDSGIREFSITDQGILVADTFSSAEAILTGHARVRGGPEGAEISPPMSQLSKKQLKQLQKPKKRGLLRRRRS